MGHGTRSCPAKSSDRLRVRRNPPALDGRSGTRALEPTRPRRGPEWGPVGAEKPPSASGPAARVPPSASTRSRMFARPNLEPVAAIDDAVATDALWALIVNAPPDCVSRSSRAAPGACFIALVSASRAT